METYPCGERQTAHQDYRQYDRIWQRVSPELDPYPELRAESGAMSVSAEPSAGALAIPEDRLPGAVPDPCCMSSLARQSLGVLQGFLDEECRQRTAYLLAARRQTRPERGALLRRMAERSLEHIRRLMAAGYLITGRCLRPLSRECARLESDWCPLLRGFYHGESCDRLNYARAADEAEDECLGALFRQLSEASREQAEELFEELSRQMCRRRR